MIPLPLTFLFLSFFSAPPLVAVPFSRPSFSSLHSIQETSSFQLGAGPSPWIVSTLAGSGQPGNENGSGRTARFNRPVGVAVNRMGELFISDRENHLIRKIDRFGWVTTFAGGGSPGFSEGRGKKAFFHDPEMITVDPRGNLYVADAGNFRIRKITPDGTVSTVAGSGRPGNKEGPALEAEFVQPTGVAVAPDGSLYIADKGAHRIKRLTPHGIVMIVAGSGEPGYRDGLGYFAQFQEPVAVAVDDVGNLYISDTGSHTVRRIDRDGIVMTVAGSGQPGDKDGLRSETAFSHPSGIGIDPEGNLILSDSQNHRIRKITLPAGRVTTVAGNSQPGGLDGIGPSSGFNLPNGIAIDPKGEIYVADSANHRIRIIQPEVTRVLNSAIGGSKSRSNERGEKGGRSLLLN